MGQIVIPFQFDQRFGSSFKGGFAPMKNSDGRTGFIDLKGAMVIPPRFQFTYGFTEGLASVKVDGGWGYIDAAGEFVIPPRFSRAYSFSEGLAAVEVKADEPLNRLH